MCSTVLYTVWYLVENHGKLEPITRLVDRCAFYCYNTATTDPGNLIVGLDFVRYNPVGIWLP